MGRRGSGITSFLRAMDSIAAQQQKVHNAEIRSRNAEFKQQERDQKAFEKDMTKQQKDRAMQFAADKSNEAEQLRTDLTTLLFKATQKPIKIDWNKYKKHETFGIKKPESPKLVDLPQDINEDSFAPKINIIDKLIKKRIESKNEAAKVNYAEAKKNRDELLRKSQEENTKITTDHEKTLEKWNEDREAFLKEQKDHNDTIDQMEIAYKNKDENAVEFYFNQVLSLLDLPEELDTDWELEYSAETGILIIDMVLPNIDIIPTLKIKKYVVTRQEFTDTEIKTKDIEPLFDKMILQLCLRTVHDIYVSDVENFLDTIVYNGIHNGVNKSTGKEESKYILSLQTKKDEFLNINVKNVDAKSCFLSFKGISGARLNELVPIAPIIFMNREDKRFVQGVDVAHTIEGQNLASMDWESFEHLIRELFEKEFAVNGAEIRITQASRDGGVDAVMFDPDPIRGGKFIIQAKRYTNVVGVSAVRDLYGTLSHEGAVKGILVTTANYGADSYEFAKNKPITLINGSNLLFLLQKHGYNARIDLEEAKRNNMLS